MLIMAKLQNDGPKLFTYIQYIIRWVHCTRWMEAVIGYIMITWEDIKISAYNVASRTEISHMSQHALMR